MKNILFLTVFSLLIFACKKDPCKDTHCLNGGTCVDGTCNCPGGYSGVNCETHDPCYGITCLNGGTCANGTCNCPPGYSGSDCSIVLTPVSVDVNQVTVTSFSHTDGSGAGWDLTDGPDPFVSLNSGTTAVLTQFVSNYYTNQFAPLTFGTSAGFPCHIPSPGSTYTIYIWDYDSTSGSDGIGGFYFKFTDFDSGFPSSFVLSGGGISITLYVTWNF